MKLPETDNRVAELQSMWDDIESEHELEKRMGYRRGCKQAAVEIEDNDESSNSQVMTKNVVLSQELGRMNYLEERLVNLGGEEIKVVGI